MLRIYIIEKEMRWRSLLAETLSTSYKVSYYTEGKDIFKELSAVQYDVIVLDLKTDNEDPFELLRWIKVSLPYSPVIITSNEEKAELVVKAIKQGAYDFIAKPYSGPKMRLAVQQALENWSLKKEINYLRHEQDTIYNFDRIIAVSPVMKDVINSLKKFSKTDATILMTGETGAGKSFLSGTIHFNSERRNKPFVKINCSNIPETLLESELFGHEKGAFTGADKRRVGRFEQAHAGTMFLDEIGDMPLSLQSKLLRVLEEKAFERIGSNQTIHSDVRVIAATNRNLKQLISEGSFREDLYYRINVLSITLPPLRDRRECIEPLAEKILIDKRSTIKKNITGFSLPVMEWIKAYSWPGNIRQLSNTIERAMILEDSPLISVENVSMLEPIGQTETQAEASTKPALATGEKEMILKALEDSLWIQKDAAKLLDISPRTLNYKIKKYDITHPRWRKNT